MKYLYIDLAALAAKTCHRTFCSALSCCLVYIYHFLNHYTITKLNSQTAKPHNSTKQKCTCDKCNYELIGNGSDMKNWKLKGKLDRMKNWS